jgi:hypothetical protein
MFRDMLLYAQILYNARMYKGAAPVFELALDKLRESSEADSKTMKRVVTDQAGMAYGMSGDISKARAIFEKCEAGRPLSFGKEGGVISKGIPSEPPESEILG